MSASCSLRSASTHTSNVVLYTRRPRRVDEYQCAGVSTWSLSLMRSGGPLTRSSMSAPCASSSKSKSASERDTRQHLQARGHVARASAQQGGAARTVVAKLFALEHLSACIDLHRVRQLAIGFEAPGFIAIVLKDDVGLQTRLANVSRGYEGAARLSACTF